jgi:microcystin-dependent protein
MNNMKKLRLVFTALIGLLFTLSVNAQTTVLSSGMSIQGIARDINNEALANIDQLDMDFTVYYLTSSTPTTILTRRATVKTDNFGVFSYVLTIDQAQYNLISTKSAYLKVSQLSVVFSDEKLQAVPYAIYAQNGVPTGSIMPYIGTTAPAGWLMCDGNLIPSGTFSDDLKALLGTTTTPDLRAMFLRGAGTGNLRTGPTVKTIQQDDLKAHLHKVEINTNYTGNHTHTVKFSNDDYSGGGGGSTGLEDDTPNIFNKSLTSSSDGNHAHNVNGDTGSTGGTETRPINYGVNYIIKL